MATILLVFESRAGQTRKIADFVAARLGAEGHAVETIDLSSAAGEAVVDAPDGIIVASPVLAGRHSERVEQFVERHLMDLEAVPAAFLSVSLAAADRTSPESLSYINRFIEQTGWRPLLARPIAGALAYRRYNGVQRLLMRIIASRRGLPTDITRDHEFTDWDGLRQFVAGFMARVRAAAQRRVHVRTA